MRLGTGRRWLWVAAVAVAVTALIVAACDGGAAAPTPTPTLPGSTVVPPDESTPTPTPLPPVGPSSYRFLYSEFGADEDTIWRVNPADTTDREEVARLGHKSGSAVVPALSPDGTRIAFNVLPPPGFDGATDAEAHVLDLESGEITVVARGVDLSTTPLWSPDGALLFLRRNVGFDVTVILVELSKPGEEDDEPSEDGEEEPPPIRTVLRQDVSDVLSFIPVGADPEDAVLFFVQVQGGTQRGTFLGRYAPATGEAVATATAVSDATATAFAMTPTPTPVSSPTPTPTPTPVPSPTPPRLSGTDYLFLSDQTAFEFSLSPDSSRLAFLVPSLIDGQFVSRAHVADLAGQQVSALSAEGLPEGEHLRPVWHPEGDRVAVGQLPAGGEPGRVAVAPLSGDDITFLQTPDKGFDVPLAWSPDGRFLAVTSFSGGSLANSGPPRLVFVATSGQRLPAQGGSEIQAIGWIEVD